MDIRNITPGQSYACKFKVEHILDEFGRIPGLSDVPLKGLGIYESWGAITTRDNEKELVEVIDEKSKKKFVVPFSDIWDVDDVIWEDKE
tara:strand:+ start:129 stop:395 length:267 start_codon:yes stop_codon:yes gene_type:complete